jgi:hypothetical protein
MRASTRASPPRQVRVLFKLAIGGNSGRREPGGPDKDLPGSLPFQGTNKVRVNLYVKTDILSYFTFCGVAQKYRTGKHGAYRIGCVCYNVL